ncbi:unnamed protein product [Closterium sp. NIES-54]
MYSLHCVGCSGVTHKGAGSLGPPPATLLVPPLGPSPLGPSTLAYAPGPIPSPRPAPSATSPAPSPIPSPAPGPVPSPRPAPSLAQRPALYLARAQPCT